MKAFVEQAAMTANGVTLVLRVGPGDESHIKAALEMRGRSVIIGLSAPINIAAGMQDELLRCAVAMRDDFCEHRECRCEQCADLEVAAKALS